MRNNNPFNNSQPLYIYIVLYCIIPLLLQNCNNRKNNNEKKNLEINKWKKKL